MNLLDHQKHFLKQRNLLRWMATLSTVIYATIPAVLIIAIKKEYWVIGVSVGLLILSAQIIVSIRQMTRLKKGGLVNLAGVIGPHRLLNQPQTHQERLMMTLIDEFSLAAGLPPPQILILEGELSLNSFSLSRDCTDSLVAVTEGALKKLKEPELTALVAFEVTRILLGYSQLNTRLWMILYFFTRPNTVSRRYLRTWKSGEKKNYPKFVAAYFLIVAGLGGHLIARLLQNYFSKISNRKTDSFAALMLEGTLELRKLFHSLWKDDQNPLKTDFRSEIRHLWLSCQGRNQDWPKRLLALPPSSDKKVTVEISPSKLGPYRPEVNPYSVRASVGRVSSFGRQLAHQSLAEIPLERRAAIGTIDGARSLTLALLLPKDEAHRKAGLSIIRKQLGEAMSDLVAKRFQEIAKDGVGTRVVALQLCLGTLHNLRNEDLGVFLTALHAVSALSETTSSFGNFVACLVAVSLDGHPWASQRSRVRRKLRGRIDELILGLNGQGKAHSPYLTKILLELNQLHPKDKENVLIYLTQAMTPDGFADDAEIEKLRLCSLAMGIPLSPEIFH